MLKCISVVFVLFSLFSVAQKNDVVHQIIYDIDRDDFGLGTTTFTFELLVDENSYKFSRKSIKSTTSEIVQTVDGFYSYHIGEIGSNIDYHLTKGENNKEYNIKDVLPKINWKIDNDKSKKIGSYNCKLAIGNYRGRVVFAYFTTEIPITIGPNNLNGLPGAILYAYTHDRDFEMKAKSIKKVKRPSHYIKYANYNFGEVISKKEYIEIRDKEQKEIDEILKIRYESISQSETGEKVKFESINNSRNTFELYYEWELNNDKN